MKNEEITYFLQRGDVPRRGKPDVPLVLLREKFAIKTLNLPSVFCAYENIFDECNTLNILDSIPQNYVPVGSVEFIKKYADIFEIDLPKNISYPECLQKYLKRDLRKGVFSDANNWEFVKPQSTKKFTGAIKADLFSEECITSCEPVWISEPMAFEAEFRYYVVDGKIVGHSRYDDFENDLCADENVVRQMISDYADQPVGYSIDVGINCDNGETVLIEVNDGWALGLYPWGNMSNESYVDLITKRWKQIISPNRKTFNVRTKIKVNIEAESLQEAEDMFFNASISFQNKQGKELQWELMDSQIEEA
jgi:hypothetical protein